MARGPDAARPTPCAPHLRDTPPSRRALRWRWTWCFEWLPACGSPAEGTWEHGNGGGGSREMVGTRGAGRKHEGLPNGLSGGTGTCSVLSHCAPCLFVCIRAVPNPSWGLLNNSRVLGCKPLPLPARMCHWVSPCPRMWLFRALGAVPSSETPPLAAEQKRGPRSCIPGPRGCVICVGPERLVSRWSCVWHGFCVD
jgi:hypothetical protein